MTARKAPYRHRTIKNTNSSKALSLVALIMIGVGAYLLVNNPKFIGFVANGQSLQKELNLNVSANQEIEVQLLNSPASILISGRLFGNGSAKIYLVINDTNKLIARVTANANPSNDITGLSVDDTNLSQDPEQAEQADSTRTTEPISLLPDKANTTDSNTTLTWKPTVANDTVQISETSVNNTNEGLVPEESTEPVHENATGIHYNKPKEQALPFEEPEKNRTAQANLTNLTGNIGSNQIETRFGPSCIDTCALSGLGRTIRLSIEVEDATVELKQLYYTLENSKPYWNSSLDTFQVNGRTEFNLSHYFVKPQGGELQYMVTATDDLTLNLTGEILTIYPQEGFESTRIITIFASNSESTISKDITVNVSLPKNVTLTNATNAPELLQGRAEVGKPVRWTQIVHVINGRAAVELPSQATKLTIQHKPVLQKPANIPAGTRPAMIPGNENESDNQTKGQNQTIVELNLGPQLVLNESLSAVEVSYETPGPSTLESNITDGTKRIVVQSLLSYKNITASTDIRPTKARDIRLYWYVTSEDAQRYFGESVNSTKRVDVTQGKLMATRLIDANGDGLIEHVEWQVPHLSNQTFEVTLTILNVQSYPMVRGNWTVAFETAGIANLSISASNGTTYGNESPADLNWLTLRCGNELINASFNGSVVFYRNWNCTSIGYHTVHVLTSGSHHQKFVFGDQVEYANNWAGWINVSLKSPANGATIRGQILVANCTVNTNSSKRYIKNISLFTNISGSWKLNQTKIVAASKPTNYKANFTLMLASGSYKWNCLAYDNGSSLAWAPNNWTAIVGTYPKISFGSPTLSSGNTTTKNYVYLNTNVTDSVNTSSFFDWNRSLVGYWNFEYYNSTGIYDNSSYHNFGKFNSGLCTSNLTGGKWGKGLKFDGVNDFVSAENSNSLNSPVYNLTVSAWINLAALPSARGEIATVVRKNSDPSPASSPWYTYWLEIETGDVVKAELEDSTDTWGGAAGSTTLTTGRWYHVAFVRKGGIVDVYLNGRLDTNWRGLTSYNPLFVGSGGMESNKLLYIGAADPYKLSGTIDEVRIFNRALSPEEINASYNSGKYRLYHNFTGLSNGLYTYNAWAINTYGNINKTSQRTINVSVPFQRDAKRFSIQNRTGQTVASLDINGNLWLKGKNFSRQTNLEPKPRSFILQNRTGQTIMYVNQSGYMFLRGNITTSASNLSVSTSSSLQIRNASNQIVALFDNKGNLKLRGLLTQNYANP